MNQLSSNQKFWYYKIIFSSTTPMLSLKISFMTVKDEYRCIRCIRCKFVYLYSTLRKKPPYSELFWSTFFPHFPAFGLNTERYSVFSPNAGKRGKNADQNNSQYGLFLRSYELFWNYSTICSKPFLAYWLKINLSCITGLFFHIIFCQEGF